MVSIIIPMFNAENSIVSCIDSIERQKYKDIEIILVNDGSTDNSKAVCEELCHKYNNIKFINVSNGGVSKARNIGLAHATGEYVQFVDADDTVDYYYTFSMLQHLIRNEADMVISSYKEISKDKETEVSYKTCHFSYMDGSFMELLQTNRLFNSPCNKIYKRACIEVGFPETIAMGEDLLFNLSYAQHCKKMSFLSCSLYNYIAQTGSLTTKYSSQKLFDVIELDSVCCTKYGLQDIYFKNLVDNVYDLFCVWAKSNEFQKHNHVHDLLTNDYLRKRFTEISYHGDWKKRVFVWLVKYRIKYALSILGFMISKKASVTCEER